MDKILNISMINMTRKYSTQLSKLRGNIDSASAQSNPKVLH